MARRKTGLSWGRTKNFWIKQCEKHNISVADVAAKLNVHLLTAKAYFTGFCKPTPYTNKILCEWMGVDYNTGMEEFDKAYEAWGLAHPNYVPYYSTYKTARGVKLQGERVRSHNPAKPKSPKIIEPKVAEPIEKPDTVAEILTDVIHISVPESFSSRCAAETTTMLQIIYETRLLSYAEYTEAMAIKDQYSLLEFVYGKVDHSTFKKLYQIYVS